MSASEAMIQRETNRLCRKKAQYLQRQLPYYDFQKHTIHGTVEDGKPQCVVNFKRKDFAFECDDYCEQSIEHYVGYEVGGVPRTDEFLDNLQKECEEECNSSIDAYNVGGVSFNPHTLAINSLSLPGRCDFLWEGEWDDQFPDAQKEFADGLDELGCEPELIDYEWKHPHEMISVINIPELGDTETPAVCFYHVTRKPLGKCKVAELLAQMNQEV